MAAFEVIALDTATPQLRAPGASDTYTFPRAVSFAQPITYGGVTLNNAVTGAGNLVLSSKTIQNKTGAYTVVAGDAGSIINCTSGTFTVSLTAAATLGSGFNCWIWNSSTSSSHSITIDPSGSETIDGVSTLILRRGEGCQIVCDGTNWQTGDKKTMRGYAENIPTSYARPVASASGSVAIGGISQATGTDSMSLGYNSAATASGTMSLGFDSQASQIYSSAIGANSAGSGARSTGTGSTSIGGSYASGTNSFAAAIANNTSSYGATGANSVAIGSLAKATGADSFALGDTNTASAQGACAFGGAENTASAAYSFAFGYQAQSTLIGKRAYASGQFAATGDAQTGNFVIRGATADATPVVLTSNNSTGAATNQVILPNNSAYAFSGIIVARQQAADGTASAAWKIEGLIRREANAASTVLVASTVTAIDNAPSWTLALSADTTNGGLAITATGAAATDIRWVATVQTSEVTYA
jgi:hypothetical protein